MTARRGPDPGIACAGWGGPGALSFRFPENPATHVGKNGAEVSESNPSVAVIIPMYNEERGAEQCVRTVKRALESLPTRTVLIVVDDGSTDATRKILETLAAEAALVVLKHERNLGYGGALRTGARYAYSAGYDYVLFMDSDLTNDPVSLPAFLRKMREGCDVIKATRYAAGGRVVGVPSWKVTPVRRVNVQVLPSRLGRQLFARPA